MKIFLVDDDTDYIDLIQHQLEMLGEHSVSAFSKAKEVLFELIQGEQCDLLITDIFMDEMDGVELILEISDMAYKGAIAIVSGASQEMMNVVASIATNGGLQLCGSYIKPITTPQLFDCISIALLNRFQKDH